MPSNNSRVARDLRQQEAVSRAADRASRTPEEQAALLDSRPGEATRERTQLGLKPKPKKRGRKPKAKPEVTNG